MSYSLTATSLWRSAKGEKTRGEEGAGKPNWGLGWTGEGERREKSGRAKVEAANFFIFSLRLKH